MTTVTELRGGDGKASGPSVPAPPRQRIARGWSSRPLPMGLDGAFALLGGDALSPDRLPADLGLDWAPELQDLATNACLQQHNSGRAWFTMPPCVITGQVGIGRTLMARRIARCAGVPFTTIDVSARGGGSLLGRPMQAPDLAMPSRIVTALASGACANPVVLITGVDTAKPETVQSVQAMVDPATSARWNEPAIGAVIDLGHVTWIIQSSGGAGVARPLGHLRRIDIRLDDYRRRLRDLTIVSEVMDDFGVDPCSIAHRDAALLEPLRASTNQSAAALRLTAERALWALTKTAR